MKSQAWFVSTALAGIAAASLVGCGEYLLHYDAQARFGDGYEFMRGISAERSSLGHFIAVFGALLYPVGCYHLYLMLRPAGKFPAATAALVGAAGFMVGAVWIGSRASISAIVNMPAATDLSMLIELYELRYETLLQSIRLCTLILSVIIAWLAWSGRSRYPRWIAFFNPIVLIVASFVIYAIAPAIGKHLMPIALNVACLVFFTLSLLVTVHKPVSNTVNDLSSNKQSISAKEIFRFVLALVKVSAMRRAYRLSKRKTLPQRDPPNLSITWIGPCRHR